MEPHKAMLNYKDYQWEAFVDHVADTSPYSVDEFNGLYNVIVQYLLSNYNAVIKDNDIYFNSDEDMVMFKLRWG